MADDATVTTGLAAKAWAPDAISTYSPTDAIPAAAILSLSTKGGAVEGDEPSLRVPFVVDDDTDVAIVPEGTDIARGDVTLDEITLTTVKVAKLVGVSREQAGQGDAANQITASIQRSIINQADALFLKNAAAPAGLTALVTTAAGSIGATSGLFAIFDAIASLEAEGGRGTHLLIHPTDFAALAKIPDETGSNRPVLGAIGSTTGRQIAGLTVVTNRYAQQGKALVLDPAEIVSAYGDLQLARSDQYYFGSDSVALRATFRFGWAIPRPTRAGRVLTLDAAA